MISENIKGLKRTKYCGQFCADDIGKNAVVFGWVQRRRDLGSLIFIDLRDRTGILQLTFDSGCHKELLDKAYKVRNEYVLAAKGVIWPREKSAVNKKLATGEVELSVSELRILSVASTPPFEITENSATNEELRLKHRYLDLRRPDLQKNMILRHRTAKIARDYFNKNEFIEIETPMLIKSTPEGARDYIVPSRVHPGSFYALPQSPQLYKQLLMAAGYDRYMQIARCFRDEDLRADRQPEFTQIDLEMSFADEEDIIAINEGFLKELFSRALGVDIETPFTRITYAKAMARFGSDKPDLRFGMEIIDITDIAKKSSFKVFSAAAAGGGAVRAIKAEGKGEEFSRKAFDALTEYVKVYKAKGLAYLKIQNQEINSSFARFLPQNELDELIKRLDIKEKDAVFIVADTDKTVVAESLGALRCQLAQRLCLVNKTDYKFVWVTEFPLLEYDPEEKRFAAKHHPFTSPMEEDIHLLDTQPADVRARAYDIVLNGTEIGGGSIRIYSNELQSKMFSALGIDQDTARQKFGYLLDAFQYGVPPHGGIAYGLDRLVMLMAGCDSIRDVIAFPKVQNASELMTQCPSEVDEKQLKELSLTLDLPEK